MNPLPLFYIGLFQKKQSVGGGRGEGGGSGYGPSRGIEEIASGFSRVKLKTTWNFQE